jgi:hypothetical protein
VSEQRSPPPGPGVQETPGKDASGQPLYDRRYAPPGDNMPPASGSSLRPVPQRQPSALPPAPLPPRVKLDRVVALPVPTLQGQVVLGNNAPAAGAKLLFVSAARRGPQQSVTADGVGRFRVTLASGSWLVYVAGADGRPTFHSKIDLKDTETRQVTLVSR